MYNQTQVQQAPASQPGNEILLTVVPTQETLNYSKPVNTGIGITQICIGVASIIVQVF